MDEKNQSVLMQVEKHATEMAKTERICERGYAHLGWLLLEVKEMDYWRVHYSTFRDYLKGVALISQKSVEQLHRYWLTVRDLTDTFTIAQLEEIGISKAMKLRVAKDYAIILPDDIIAAALDSKVTVRDLKKLITTTLRMPEEEGDWMDLDCAFYVTADQRATIEEAIRVAMHTEPLTKVTVSKSAQMLDIIMKWSMEFLGAHSGDGI